MQTLATHTDQDFGYPVDKTDPESYRLLKASRAVLVNSENKVALMYAPKELCHKLPGGGAKNSETEEETVKREVREETGAETEIQEVLGEIIEYRNQYKLKQISTGFLVKQIGELIEPQLDPNEIKNGLRTEWYTIDEAIKILENDDSTLYGAIYMKKRDLVFLKKAQELLK